MSNASRGELRVGVVGAGFMGKTHIQAWQAAKDAGYPVRLAAVCDKKRERLTGVIDVDGNIDTGAAERLFDPAEVTGYTDAADLIADDTIDAVSICTRTDTHVDLSIAAMEACKHVLVEKPVALATADVERLAQAAASSDRFCMPAMCMRFWPGWAWLRDAIDDDRYGAVLSATFHRLGTIPPWSREFYTDHAKSGGALIDLHIHDVDFVRFLFGEPREVTSTGSLDHVTSFYRFDKGPGHVVAEGGWDHTTPWDFRMRYVVVFENATVDYDLTRDPLLVVYKDGEKKVVAVGAGTGYDGEVRHFVDVTMKGESPAVTMGDAVRTNRLLEAERESLATRRSVNVDE